MKQAWFFEKNLPLIRGTAWNVHSAFMAGWPFRSVLRLLGGGGAKPSLKRPFPRYDPGMDGRDKSTHGGLL